MPLDIQGFGFNIKYISEKNNFLANNLSLVPNIDNTVDILLNISVQIRHWKYLVKYANMPGALI